MNIVLLGIQGSGKGTLVSALEKCLDFSLVSVGLLLREEIATGSKLGQYISSVIDGGNMLDTKTVMEVISGKLKHTKDITIFDGFPRNKEQANELDKIAKVDLVLYLNLPEQVAKERIFNRLTCTKCGNISSKLIEKSTICSKCGAKLASRVDDTPKAVEKRLEQYYKYTCPLLNKYIADNKVVELDATKPTNELLNIVLEVINEHNN
jgi:adenylate kinase